MADEGPQPEPHDQKLTVENRRRIFELIKMSPGIHLREIVRELELPYGTAEYHLRVLEEEEIVRAVVEDNFRRYFPADFAYSDRAVLGLLRKRPIRRIAVVLLERGELTHQELAAAADLKPSTLSYHLQRLEAAKVVVVAREGRFSRVRLVDPKLIARLIVAHKGSFGDEAVDRFLETWSGFEAAGPQEAAPPTAPSEEPPATPAKEPADPADKPAP
jgi:DNA-binding transcriptional ArsR family regulator